MERRIGGAALAALVGHPSSDGSTYAWLASTIERLVADGQLTHGTRLPGERDVATALGLSRTTVTHAYARLRERGFAEARHGSGTRVRIPGGPVGGDGEPLAGVLGLTAGSAADGVINMNNAAPAAAKGIAERFVDATRSLGAYTHGGGYYRDGIPDLRAAIADRYTARGAATTPDQILVTTGALAGLAATSLALLGRGSRVAVEPSGYPNALASLRAAGARFVPVPERDGGRALDLVGLSRSGAVTRLDAMLVTPDFHNPTGRLVPDADREVLARLWRHHGIVGLVDETCVDLWWDAPPGVRPMAAFAPDCVSFGSASKTYWGGLRLGWVRAPQHLLAAIAAARVTLDLGAPVLDQLVLATMIREQPSLDDDRRRDLGARRVVLREQLMQRCPGWTCDLPPGGLSLWWWLPEANSAEIVRRAGAHGLSMPSGAAFSLDGRGLGGRLRTPFTLPHGELMRAVDILAEVNASLS